MLDLVRRAVEILSTPGFDILFLDFLFIIILFYIFFYIIELPMQLINYLLQRSLLFREIRKSLKRTDPIDLDYLASLYDLKK